jgi:hypothetical protein
MDGFLTAFDSARAAASNGDELFTAMKTKYPDWSVPMLLAASARAQFRPKT